MQIASLILRKPRFTQIASFLLSTVVVLLSFYGIGASIDDGDIKNHPEVLRGLFFAAFSIALTLKLCLSLGFKENNASGKMLMFSMLYIPVGLLGAYLIGIF